MQQCLPSHKLVYNGGFSTYVAEILCGISYKVCSTFIRKFGTIKLFILILDVFAIIQQSPCCHVVTTSKIFFYQHIKIQKHKKLHVTLEKL